MFQHFERPLGVFQLPLDLAEQGQELRTARRQSEGRVELLARAFVPAEIEIDVREKVAGRDRRRVERQRLAELGDRLAHEIRRANRAVGDAEEHVPFRRAGIDSQDFLELAHRVVGPVRARKELGSDTRQPLLISWLGGRSLRRDRRLARVDRGANKCSGQNDERCATADQFH